MITRFNRFTFDSDRRQILKADGEELHVTRKAFDLLALLIDEAPRVVTKGELHERLWPGTFVSDATLVSLVKELRRELQDRDTDSPIIRTSHGVGYAFCGVVERSDASRSPIGHWVIARHRRIPLIEGTNVIGRDPAAGVWLDAAGVSRRHAQIEVRGQQARLEDLGSKNGTMREEERLDGPVTLHDGDTIRVGPIAIVYRMSEMGMSTETTAIAASREPPRQG